MRETVRELEAAYARELVTDPRAAAETAYALAFRYRNEDVDGRRDFGAAKDWAVRAIGLLDSLPSESLEDVASSRADVGGVEIPGLLHSSVVRERLADVLF